MPAIAGVGYQFKHSIKATGNRLAISGFVLLGTESLYAL